MDGTGFGEMSKNRRGQGADSGSFESRNGNDVGLDRATLANEMSGYGGKLFER
jgi:hypothetical protein